MALTKPNWEKLTLKSKGTKASTSVEKPEKIEEAKEQQMKAEKKDMPQSKTKREMLKEVNYNLSILKSLYPLTFMSEDNIKPLKKGIEKDILKGFDFLKYPDFSSTKIRRTVSFYVRSLKYRESFLKPNVFRVDLQGCAAGFITTEEIAHAKKEIERIKNKHKKKDTAINEQGK